MVNDLPNLSILQNCSKKVTLSYSLISMLSSNFIDNFKGFKISLLFICSASRQRRSNMSHTSFEMHTEEFTAF